MIPETKDQFKQYCLRKLGHPIIQINVTPEQIDDRVDEALSFFHDYHYNGSDLVYLKHQITDEDKERGYILIPDNIIGIPRIFEMDNLLTGTGMWNVQYQYVLNNISDLTSFGLQNYYMSMQNIEFMNELLSGKTMIRYNRSINKLYIDRSKSYLDENSYIIIEAYAYIDGDEHGKLWSDRWLQNYATVLIKEQWGSVLGKYQSVQLLSGITFNGDQIAAQASEERKNMEETAMNSLQGLVHHFIG